MRFARLQGIVGVAALILALSQVSVVRADEVSAQDKASAMEKFDLGSKAFDQKRYKDAIDLFLQADAIVKNPAFAYNAALAYDAMGDTAAALRWAREYLRRSPSAPDQAAVRDRIAKFEAHLRESGLRQLTVLSTPSGATLLVDHRPMGVTPWTGELIPGSHVLELRMRGYADKATTAELDGDGSVEVSAELTEEKTAKPAPVVVAVETPPPAWLLPTSIAFLGAGAVSAGISIGLEVARSGAEGKARDAKTQVDAANEYDHMKHLQLGARVAAGVAGGLAVVGATLLTVRLATGRGGAKAPAAAAIPSISIGPAAGSFSIPF